MEEGRKIHKDGSDRRDEEEKIASMASIAVNLYFLLINWRRINGKMPPCL